MPEPKTQCTSCGCEILQTTADEKDGHCAPCHRKATTKRKVFTPVAPVSRSTLDNLIANSERDAVIGALFEPALDKVNFRPADMTEGDIIVYTVATFFGETTNGGLIQYFTNQSGSWAHKCGPSLRRIGADKYADIVEACIQRFTDAESAHEPQWELDLDDYIDDHTMPFEDIEEAFWEYYRANEDELLALLYSYIRDNRDVFAGTTNGA